MPNFEDLRMIDLVGRFESLIGEIASTHSLKKISAAGEALQNVYNFHLTAENTFSEAEEYLKNMYSSFNYAAVIVNDAIKKGGLKKDDNELLAECMEILLKCCRTVKSVLGDKKP